MHLVPIPTTAEHVQRSAKHWLPFLSGISKKSREPVESLIGLVLSHEVQVVLVWDGEKAVALVGVRYCLRGEDRIAELVWLTGLARDTWQHLLSELEEYLRQVGCVECRPICRPGWSKLLKAHGYRMTHVVMEKSL